MISTKRSSSAALTHQNDAADKHFELAMHAMVLQMIRQKEAAKSHTRSILQVGPTRNEYQYGTAKDKCACTTWYQ